MEEIANNIFIEQSYPGVVSSVLKLNHGLLLVDGPFRADDYQAWYQKVINLGGGIGQLLIMLDTQKDRLVGTPLGDIPIVAHENALAMIQDTQAVSRTPEMKSGSASEPYDLPQNTRWCMPDMTYQQQLNIHWDDEPVVITHQPGAHLAGSWVRYETERVVFVGDSVVIQQPPFLAYASLERWVDELSWLCSETFKNYKIVSGRNGIVQQKSILKMIDFLELVQNVIEELLVMEDPEEGLTQWVPQLLKKLCYDREKAEVFQQRLAWGLTKLLKRYQAGSIISKGMTHAV
jgi:hypothetical protein